jgi:hypothetical protein
LTEDPRIARLGQFRELLLELDGATNRSLNRAELRSAINQEKAWVEREVVEAGCFVTVTIGPPPAIGGLIARNTNPFNAMFDPPYGYNLVPTVVDMVDQTIGVLRDPPRAAPSREAIVEVELVSNYAFVAMPIDDARPEFGDVLDAIKEACNRCGTRAERVDEPASNERITDRILQSIRTAEFVVVDLSDSRPNVYYEAGFAHALGKLPIYIAKRGTAIGFDLRDYPVIFFDSLRQLKDDLERRLRGIGKGAT